MPHLCPRPCSRLATAAVFISVGVVQFVVGTIFLRSNYVYLLAGPDFWTSAGNIVVGSLLGLSANVWKNSKKRRPSKKHFLRRNLLLALLFSELLMNLTTLGIFLLGEGNTLLSIRLENGKNYEYATLGREILAYAYVTSVCCPIVCIVVTIVSLSEICFKYAYTRKSSLETNTVLNVMKYDRAEPIRWVYTPELFNLTRKRLNEFSSSSSESDGDPKHDSTYHNYSNSSEEIHDVFSRMAQGKRESMISDSAVMLREMDLRRKNKYDMFDKDGSYVGPMIQRARESILGEKRPTNQTTRFVELSETQIKKPLGREYSVFNKTNVPSKDVTVKRTKYAKSRRVGSIYNNPYSSEELVNEYQNASSKMIKHYPSQYKKFRTKFRSASDITDRGVGEFAGIHKKPRISEEFEPRNLPLEYRDQRKWKSYEKMREREESKSFEESSPSFCFSPDGSDFGGDSIFEMSRRSSWAGEIVPISTKRTSGLKLSHKLIPVANPVVPALPQTYVAPKISDDSGIGSVASNNFIEAPSSELKNKNNLSSFQEDLAVRNADTQEHPKMGSQSVKKYDMKVVKMASISEEPNLEINMKSEDSPEKSNLQDNGHLRSWVSYSGKKSPLRNRDVINVRRDTTLKRKGSPSSKALRKIWSMAMSECKSDFRDQVVDEDSLIGLSEEELIQRQLRTRFIRKVVQQRMKEKVAAM